MAIVKEWICMAHGDFDGPSAVTGASPPCPHGCDASMVERVFRTPPALQSASFKGINRTMQTLAREHGLSNIENAAAIRNGIGMRRASPDTHRRLNTATEMIIGKARAAGLQGTDASAYFKPLSHLAAVGGGAPPSLRKSGTFSETTADGVTHTYGAGTTIVGPPDGPGIPLPPMRPILEAAPFDGRKLGTPEAS